MRIENKTALPFLCVGFLGLALALPTVARTHTGPFDADQAKQTLSTFYRAHFHRTLAQHYKNEAVRFECDAHAHVHLARMYRHSFQQEAPLSLNVVAVLEGAADAFNKMASIHRGVEAMHDDIANRLDGNRQPQEQDAVESDSLD
jgi:hypothetical protein